MNMVKSALWGATASFLFTGAAFFSTVANAVEVDVAVAYDSITQEYYSGSPSTAIIAMVDQANTYLANSHVDIQLNLVATGKIDLDLETEDFQDAGLVLKTFRKNDEAEALRDNSGADFMTLIIDDLDGCGIGYVTTKEKSAFNVIQRSCMSRSYLHEMGHNMGLGHSLAQGSKGSAYSWGIGYGVDGVFSTLMAYEDAYHVRRRSYLLSNPDYECSGYPCGIKNVADAAEALNKIKYTVADHRQSIRSESSPSPTPTATTTTIETGVVSVRQIAGEWGSVRFDNQFLSTPVVVMGPISQNGGTAATMRIRNVTKTGFDYQLNEWDYSDGDHTTETVSWLATVEGEQNWNGMQIYAGKTSNVTQYWKSVSFGDNLTSTPVIIAQKEIARSGSASAIRMRNASRSGVDFFLQEEEASDGYVAGDAIHYIAVMTGKGSVNGLNVEAGLALVDDSWSNIMFNDTYANTKILSNLQSYLGTDTSALRYQNLTSSNVQIHLEEDLSSDQETGHTSETLGWMVIGN